MNRRYALLGLFGLAGILAILILVELLPGPAAAPPPEMATAPAAGDEPVAAAGRGDQSTAQIATLLHRPLFAANRRPEAEVAHDDTNPDPTVDDRPRLSGIVLAPPNSRAIFQPSGDAKPISVGVGDRIGPWTVKEIAGTGVTVTGSGADTVLRPKRDPALESEAAQAAAALGVAEGPAPPPIPGIIPNGPAMPAQRGGGPRPNPGQPGMAPRK